MQCTFETKHAIITVSQHPTLQHGHPEVFGMYVPKEELFIYLDCSYAVWYVYIKCIL